MPDGEITATPLEEKLNTIKSKLTELEDLQLVNKLDIVNLKNEIEKIRLTASTPSLETLQRIKELGRVVENAEEFKKMKILAENVDKIMAEMQGASPQGLEDIIRVIDDINKRVGKLETQGLGMKPEEAGEYSKMVEELRSSLKSLPKGAGGVLKLSNQIERLRLMVEENTKNVWKLKSRKPGTKPLKPRRVLRPEGMVRRILKKPPAIVRRVKEPPAKPGIVKCSKCGTGLPPHARFCRKCGTRV